MAFLLPTERDTFIAFYNETLHGFQTDTSAIIVNPTQEIVF